MSELERVETGLGEECGVFGAYDMDGGDVAPSVYYGLFALQHRGQESCGQIPMASGKFISERD